MLVSSLPSLGKTFQVEMPPISRFQLDKRLKLLTPAHAALLAEIERVLHWDHLNSHYDDGELIESALMLLSKLHEKHFETIRDIIQWRLNFRTLLAALRYRQRGDDNSSLAGTWGVGTLTRHIENHWQHPCFNLQSRYPCLPQAYKQLLQDDTMGLEQTLFNASWEYMHRCASGHFFDFTTVVKYVLMWNILARWSSYDADSGVKNFEDLVSFSMRQHSNPSYQQ